MSHTMTENTTDTTNLLELLAIYNIGGTAEVADLLECPKQQVHSLRKNPKFPTPVRELAATPLWRLSDVSMFKETWKRRGPRKQETMVD